MIKVEYKNNNFVVSGTFDLGYIGKYSDDKIEIGFSFDELCNELDEYGIIYPELKEKLNNTTVDENEFAAVLTDFYNELQNRVKDNQQKINNEFLVNMLIDMNDSGNEFWNNPDVLKDEYKNKTFSYEEVYNDNFDKLHDLSGRVNEDIEDELRALLPMFDFDKFLSKICPESLYFNTSSFSYQCSDGFDQQILCGAYDELDENFDGTDWHNF